MLRAKILANAIFLIHLIFVLIIIFGWLVPELWPVYITLLVGSLISELVLNYCVLSKWEFDLRKKIDPTTNYDYSFSTYYTYRLTQKYISNEFIQIMGTVFLIASILISLYFRFMI